MHRQPNWHLFSSLVCKNLSRRDRSMKPASTRPIFTAGSEFNDHSALLKASAQHPRDHTTTLQHNNTTSQQPLSVRDVGERLEVAVCSWLEVMRRSERCDE